MLSIIIPVLNQIEFTDNCLKSLRENIIQPPEIILIDNGSTDPYRDLIEKYRDLNMLYVRNETNVGVNSAWNYGIYKTRRPYVLFLNNDTYCNKYFIKKILKTMEDPEIGICIPIREVTIKRVELVNKDEDPVLEKAKYIEGWAYTLRREIYNKIGPIPSILKTYMGDTYYFESSECLGYKVMQMINNTVWHSGSVTIKTRSDQIEMRREHKEENHSWRKMRESIFKEIRQKNNTDFPSSSEQIINL